MVSDRILRRYKKLWKASSPWFLDSGGFTELSMFGSWTVPITEYIERVERYYHEIGNLDHIAPQDWMCEAFILDKTKRDIIYHQERTVENFLELQQRKPELPWVPVLQGWSLDDYQKCRDLYTANGIDLQKFRLVGLGTVCRRQSTREAAEIIDHFSDLRLHAFGYKIRGLANSAAQLYSADSMAWSYAGRMKGIPEHSHLHKNCANCREYAESWYNRNIVAKGFI